MTLEKIAVWQVLYMALPATLIPILYHRRQAWWRKGNWHGRAFMTLAVGLMLLVNFAVTFRFLPEFPAKDWIKFGVYSVLMVAFTWLAALMARTSPGRDRR